MALSQSALALKALALVDVDFDAALALPAVDPKVDGFGVRRDRQELPVSAADRADQIPVFRWQYLTTNALVFQGFHVLFPLINIDFKAEKTK